MRNPTRKLGRLLWLLRRHPVGRFLTYSPNGRRIWHRLYDNQGFARLEYPAAEQSAAEGAASPTAGSDSRTPTVGQKQDRARSA
jgi:hypothetical protein